MRAESPYDATIVMFGDGRDWHGRTLLKAFKRRGLKPLLAPLNACGFSSDTATGLAIPGLGDRLPEGTLQEFIEVETPALSLGRRERLFKQYREAQQFLKEETGYQRIQGSKPQTLSYGLTDSPAGTAACGWPSMN